MKNLPRIHKEHGEKIEPRRTRRARRKGKALTESAENSEDDPSVDTRGSLKVPCKQGVPIGAIGTNGECLVPKINKLILGPQDLSTKPWSDPRLDKVIEKAYLTLKVIRAR